MSSNDPQAITYLLKFLKILMSNLKHFKLTHCYSQGLSHNLELLPKEIEGQIYHQQPLSLTIIITIFIIIAT